MLAQGIDGRIRYLGEQLVEVVKERAGLGGEAGEGRVDAHGGERDSARDRHGAHHLVDVVPMVTQFGGVHGHQPARPLARPVDGPLVVRGGDVVERERLLGDPVAERLELRHASAQLVVIRHARLRKVDFDHLTRTEQARGEHVCRIDLDGADLRGEQEAIVSGHVVACGAQAVAVEGGAEGPSVGECDGGGAVPGLHEHGLICIVGAPLGRERLVVIPGLGYEHGYRAGEGPAVHDQEFKDVVEDGRVGALSIDDGQHAVEIMLEHGGVQVGFARANPVDVALQGVDLTIVDDEAIGVGAFPAGRGVGRVTGVDERDGGFDGGVVEVGVEAPHLGGDEHALVHDGPCAHGADVEDLPIE